MTERQEVTMAKFWPLLNPSSPNYSAGEYMPRIRIRARAGEPNWRGEIRGDVGISVLGPFLAMLDRL
jgi:hypothetical protein